MLTASEKLQLQYTAMNGREHKGKNKRKRRAEQRTGALVVHENALCKFGI
jgi:hypothetical protein